MIAQVKTQARREPVLFVSAVLLILMALGFMLQPPQAAVRGPFPFLDPAASAQWEMGSDGPELVLRATARMTPGVKCDEDAVLTRYWDLGGELIVTTAKRTANRPTGTSYPINRLTDGEVGIVRFRAEDVPWNAVAYVTKLTAPIGSCGADGWWGERESVRLQIPPRPDVRSDG